MLISLIVAMAENGVIGNNGALPWHLPADLKHFKTLTMGKPMIMGRKTFESIGKPLPGRTSIVLTRRNDFAPDNVEIVNTWPAALDTAKGVLETSDHDEVMVIGGAEIYGLALADANRLYVTEIHETVEGDTEFPTLDQSHWHETSREDFDGAQAGEPAFSFVTLERST